MLNSIIRLDESWAVFYTPHHRQRARARNVSWSAFMRRLARAQDPLDWGHGYPLPGRLLRRTSTWMIIGNIHILPETTYAHMPAHTLHLPHSPYSADLDLCDFNCFGRLKRQLPHYRFESEPDLKMRCRDKTKTWKSWLLFRCHR